MERSAAVVVDGQYPGGMLNTVALYIADWFHSLV